MEKQTVALFDLDIIAYRASAAVEQRKIEVQHLSSGNKKIFSTRTEFKNFLKDKNREYEPDKYNIIDLQIPEPEEHAFQIVKKQVNTIKQEIRADRMEGFVGKGDTNFRLNLELPKPYKGNRDTMLRPVHLKASKEHALKKYPGGLIQGVEADDHLVIRSHELIEAGHRPVIITIDKDSWSCVGTEFYNWLEDDAKIVKVPPFGWLRYNFDKKKVEGLGLNFYCYQMLHEDAADNYGINDLHKERFGARSVVEYLNQAQNVDDLFRLTEAKYKEWFPEPITYVAHTSKTVQKDFRELLELYHACAYMKRKQNDPTTFYSLWEEFK